MKSASKMCKKAGCPSLATKEGYCDSHYSNRFANLTAEKELWKKQFYSSWKWRQKSISFRRAHPFCEKCLPKKVIGTLVHHSPELVDIVNKNLNPFDDQYLHTSCLEHHQSELSKKKKGYKCDF